MIKISPVLLKEVKGSLTRKKADWRVRMIRHGSEEDIEAPTPSSSGDLDSNGIIERENITYSYTDCIERKLEERIEDFADLNEGEMKFFKLWNRYLRSLPGVGAVHMPAVVLR